MQDIRKHKESFFHTRFWIVVLTILCIILSISLIKIYKKYSHAKSIRDDYRAELVQTNEQKLILEKNIENLSTDRGLEFEIRDRYRVVKQGEQMILIVDNTKKPDESDVPVAEPRPGIFSRFLQFLKDL